MKCVNFDFFILVPNSPLSSGPTQATNSTGIHQHYNEMFGGPQQQMHHTGFQQLPPQNMNTNNNSNSVHNTNSHRQASNEEQQREFTIDDIAHNENYNHHQVPNHTTFGIGLDDSQDNDDDDISPQHNNNNNFEVFTDNHIGLS